MADSLIFDSPAYVSRIRRWLNRANFRMGGSPVSIPATLMSIEFEELVELFGTHLSRYRGGGPGTQLEESGLQNNALRAQFGGLRSPPIAQLKPRAARRFICSGPRVPPIIPSSPPEVLSDNCSRQPRKKVTGAPGAPCSLWLIDSLFRSLPDVFLDALPRPAPYHWNGRIGHPPGCPRQPHRYRRLLTPRHRCR
jgi:hypothetical protein